MAPRPFPRYFVARGNDDAASERLVDPISSIHALDSFFVGGRHVSEREYIVTVDQANELNLLPGEDKSVFANEVQSELTYADMVGSGGRLLDAAEFYLFSVQLLEQPGDTPGLNDPVYLYGTLYGPFPATSSTQPAGLEGQLTVTRGDLLEGLIQALKHPFAVTPEGDGGPAMRSLHITLAGDREEEIARGAGIVLAYPLLPGEIIQTNPSNELIVTQMLYDVLSSLKDDMVKEKVNNPLRTMTLPVPNRMLLEEQLKQRGYTIEGNTAVIKTTVTQGFQGFLASAFGSIMKDRLELPPEGTLNEFLQIAERALKSFNGWPPKRIWALQQRVTPASADIRMRAARFSTPSAPPRQVKVPTPTAAPPPTQTHAHGRPRTTSQGQLSTWMKDFVDSHQKPGAPAARLTTANVVPPARNTPPPPARARKAEWMNDFESPSSTSVPNKLPDKSKEEEKSSPAQSKPDWMNDFQ